MGNNASMDCCAGNKPRSDRMLNMKTVRHQMAHEEWSSTVVQSPARKNGKHSSYTPVGTPQILSSPLVTKSEGSAAGTEPDLSPLPSTSPNAPSRSHTVQNSGKKPVHRKMTFENSHISRASLTKAPIVRQSREGETGDTRDGMLDEREDTKSMKNTSMNSEGAHDGASGNGIGNSEKRPYSHLVEDEVDDLTRQLNIIAKNSSWPATGTPPKSALLCMDRRSTGSPMRITTPPRKFIQPASALTQMPVSDRIQ